LAPFGNIICGAIRATLTDLREEQKSGKMAENKADSDIDYISKFKSFKESNKEIQGNDDDASLQNSEGATFK
jgi:hypothetical protein